GQAVLAVLAMLARGARCAWLRAAARGASLRDAAWRRPARDGDGRGPDERRRALGECGMLRIYGVAIEMVGGAASVADAIERRDGDLARQMRRAAASVALNTAEGAGNIGGHKRQRYQTALGSAREVMACIDVAKAMRYIDEVDAAFVDRVD